MCRFKGPSESLRNIYSLNQQKHTVPSVPTWSPTVVLSKALRSLTMIDRTGNRKPPRYDRMQNS